MAHPGYKYLEDSESSQPQLAAKAGITTEYLNMLLTGRRWPGYDLARRLEEITGIPWPVWMSFNR